MSYNPFNFDHQKATQILNFFASKAGGKIHKIKALKLIFLADRYHLRKYGRLTSNDCYVAMKLGPVPSNSMDIAEADDFLNQTLRSYASKFIKAINSGMRIKSVSPVNYDYFSDSDLEALNFAWDNFGHYVRWSLSDFTHNYPEWKRHEAALRSGSKVEDMILDDFFEDPDNDSINKCYELSDTERKLRREQLSELVYLESLWR